MYGGSTGGWEAIAAQIFYPDEYNGAWGACPDPIDFRAYTVINIYQKSNAYYAENTWKKVPRPGKRNYLGGSRQRPKTRTTWSWRWEQKQAVGSLIFGKQSIHPWALMDIQPDLEQIDW